MIEQELYMLMFSNESQSQRICVFVEPQSLPFGLRCHTVTDTVFTVDLGDGSVLYIFGPCTRHVDCSLMQVSEQERDGRSE